MNKMKKQADVMCLVEFSNVYSFSGFEVQLFPIKRLEEKNMIN